MDLGFVGKTLSGGLEATFDHAGWNSLSVAGSPGTSIKNAHDITSFMAYSMETNRLTMAIRTDKVARPNEHQQWFRDEYITTDRIPSAGIVAVAANERTLATPLSELKLSVDDNFEFARQLDHLQSNIDWARRLCGAAVGEALQKSLLPPMPEGERRLKPGVPKLIRMQESIFREAAERLRAELGREPTVRDALELTIREAGSSAVILTWDNRAKQALQDVNSRIIRKEPNIPSLPEVAEETRTTSTVPALVPQPSTAPVAGDVARPSAATGVTSSTRHAMRAAAASISSTITAGRKGRAGTAAPAAERERSSWQLIRSALNPSAARPGTPSAGRTH
ncbi:hypothetical protein ACIBEF_32415 [Micromonospora sp. NPDC050795]|uniref:hypothetical protein n=1 Tax=Micromonospora sp. NPDC050795 TaxID=3364282 RepID=UPI0037946B1A